MINLIYSISHKGDIIGDGDRNSLVFNIKEDLMFFKKMTINSTIIMGRKTYESLPIGGLPNRKHVIISNKIKSKEDAKKILKNRYIENLVFIKSDELYDYIKKESKDNKVTVIGGAMLYNHFLENSKFFNIISNIYVTEVERVPKIKNPTILKNHHIVKENCDCKILKTDIGCDRLDSNNLVNYRILRYYKN